MKQENVFFGVMKYEFLMQIRRRAVWITYKLTSKRYTKYALCQRISCIKVNPGDVYTCVPGHTTIVMMSAVKSKHILYATTGRGTSMAAMASFFGSDTG